MVLIGRIAPYICLEEIRYSGRSRLQAQKEQAIRIGHILIMQMPQWHGPVVAVAASRTIFSAKMPVNTSSGFRERVHEIHRVLLAEIKAITLSTFCRSRGALRLDVSQGIRLRQ